MLAEIERFVNWLRRRNPEARTWRDYHYDLKLFVAAVGDQPPAAVTFHDVDRFVMQQVTHGREATINRRLAALQSLYAFLADEDPALVCPVLPHRHCLRVRERLPRPVQEPDLARFFAAIHDARDRAMFVLMLRCGLRISEVANLQLADLFLAEPHPRLVAHGKGAKERVAYLARESWAALNEWLEVRPPTSDEAVFVNCYGRRLSVTGIQKRLPGYRA